MHYSVANRLSKLFVIRVQQGACKDCVARASNPGAYNIDIYLFKLHVNWKTLQRYPQLIEQKTLTKTFSILLLTQFLSNLSKYRRVIYPGRIRCIHLEIYWKVYKNCYHLLLCYAFKQELYINIYMVYFWCFMFDFCRINSCLKTRCWLMTENPRLEN